MAQFRNLTELQRYLEENIYNVMEIDTRVEDVLREAMRDAVLGTVYTSHVHTPEYYERREDDGGLSDTRNMSITNVEIVGTKVKITFENLTEGYDNLKGQYTADLIEFGEGHDGKHWGNSEGDWANPRPFVSDAINNLKSNPDELINAMKRNFKMMRFKVK